MRPAVRRRRYSGSGSRTEPRGAHNPAIETVGQESRWICCSSPVLTACRAAFAGAMSGKRLLASVTLRTVQLVVAAAMLPIGAASMAGLV